MASWEAECFIFLAAPVKLKARYEKDPSEVEWSDEVVLASSRRVVVAHDDEGCQLGPRLPCTRRAFNILLISCSSFASGFSWSCLLISFNDELFERRLEPPSDVHFVTACLRWARAWIWSSGCKSENHEWPVRSDGAKPNCWRTDCET